MFKSINNMHIRGIELMSKTMREFRNKFKIEQLKIYETNYWIWSLRPHQATIGAGILSLKRGCTTFGELDSEEYCDLGSMIKVIEGTLKQSFKYDIVNYLMLMMVDKQVHYHIIPRYEKKVEILNRIWEDSAWPEVPELSGDTLTEDELLKICSYIQRNLKMAM